jgi:hypothetical protein
MSLLVTQGLTDGQGLALLRRGCILDGKVDLEMLDLRLRRHESSSLIGLIASQ